MTIKPTTLNISGMILAAGQGTRYGKPKIYAHDGLWLTKAINSLAACTNTTVLISTTIDQQQLQTRYPGISFVVAAQAAQGLSYTIRAAITRAKELDAHALVLRPVDTPDLDARVVQRVIDTAAPSGTAALARAVYHGEPGHPVLIGSAHFDTLLDELSFSDQGAHHYLTQHQCVTIECSDLASGQDYDTP